MACEACGEEQRELIEVTPGASREDWLPLVRCPKCGSSMELDDLVDKYNFLLQHNPQG